MAVLQVKDGYGRHIGFLINANNFGWGKGM